MALTFQPIGDDANLNIIAYVSGDVLTIRNNSKGSITGVYFDGGSEPLLMPTVDVSFTPSSHKLPGGKQIDFSNTWSFAASAPAPKNGVIEGESVSFRVAELPNKIGVHVQALVGGESASYFAAIPEPSCLTLLACSVILTILRRR